VLGTPLAKNHWLFHADEVKRTAPANARAAQAQGD